MGDLIELKLVTEGEAECLHRLQVEAFMPLYEKYQDDETSPAKESLGRLTEKIIEANSDFYFIVFNGEKIGGVRVRWYQDKTVYENVNWISPIFIIPQYQNKGIAGKVIEQLYCIYPNTIEWRLYTIKQETGNCHLYEKCGFVRVGDNIMSEREPEGAGSLMANYEGTSGDIRSYAHDIEVSKKMTLVNYVKNCISVRRFREEDAEGVRSLIVRNFLEINSKDYGIAAMEELAKIYDVDKVLNIASYAHMYVFEWNETIVGTGAISSFWGSETESILLTIFVLPEFHGKGIGRKIIYTLERDEFYVRANRIEIPASITAIEFYRKYGYDYKNGIKEMDKEGHYRLEKFKEAGMNLEIRIYS